MSNMKVTLEAYIEAIDSGLDNALVQLIRAPVGSVVSVSDAIGMFSIFKSQTMDAKLKIAKGEL